MFNMGITIPTNMIKSRKFHSASHKMEHRNIGNSFSKNISSSNYIIVKKENKENVGSKLISLQVFFLSIHIIYIF